MNRSAFHHTIFLAAMALASSAFAGTEILRCVSTDGRVTLTDEPCQTGELSIAIPAADEEVVAPAPAAVAANKAPAIRHIVLAPQQLRRDTWVRKAASPRSQSPDVATLKAARANMLAMDSAAALMRQHRIAGNN